MNKKPRQPTTRRTFLGRTAKSGLLLALGKGTTACAESPKLPEQSAGNSSAAPGALPPV